LLLLLLMLLMGKWLISRIVISSAAGIALWLLSLRGRRIRQRARVHRDGRSRCGVAGQGRKSATRWLLDRVCCIFATTPTSHTAYSLHEHLPPPPPPTGSADLNDNKNAKRK
jgi:hypothetical protein